MEENRFGEIQVFTGAETQQEQSLTPVIQQPTAMSSIESSRSVAEAQAAMVVARMSPRSEENAYMKIMRACKRKSLAEGAKYAFRRGGTLVTGASIRLAEVMAQSWGNTTYGFRELARQGDTSEVEAFCWDLETNTRVTRTFQVRHYRDTKKGSQKITAERDKYEHIASQAQRRVRACILEIIPGDIVDAACDQCDKTIASDGRPLEDRVRDMLMAFSEYGITKEMIEGRLSHKLTAIVPQELVQLTQIYRSIKDGVAPREEFFNLDLTQPKKEAPKKSKEDSETIKKLAEGYGKVSRKIKEPQEVPPVFDGKLHTARNSGKYQDDTPSQRPPQRPLDPKSEEPETPEKPDMAVLMKKLNAIPDDIRKKVADKHKWSTSPITLEGKQKLLDECYKEMGKKG